MPSRMETVSIGDYNIHYGKINAGGRTAEFFHIEPTLKPNIGENEHYSDTDVKAHHKVRKAAAIGTVAAGFAGVFAISPHPAGAISCDTPEPVVIGDADAYHKFWERWINDPNNHCGAHATSSTNSGQSPSVPTRGEATSAGGQLYMPAVSYLPECPPGWKGFVVEDLEANKEGERRELELGTFKANITLNSSSTIEHAIDLGDIIRADGASVKYVGSAPDPGTYCVSPTKATEAPATTAPRTTTTTALPAESVPSLPAEPTHTNPTEWVCPYPGVRVTFYQASTNERYYAFANEVKKVEPLYDHPMARGDAELAGHIYPTDPSYSLQGSAEAPPRNVPICILPAYVDVASIPGTPRPNKKPSAGDIVKGWWQKARDKFGTTTKDNSPSYTTIPPTITTHPIKPTTTR